MMCMAMWGQRSGKTHKDWRSLWDVRAALCHAAAWQLPYLEAQPTRLFLRGRHGRNDPHHPTAPLEPDGALSPAAPDPATTQPASLPSHTRPTVRGPTISSSWMTVFFWPATAAEYDSQYGGISPIAVPMPQSTDVKMTCESQQFAGSRLARRPGLASHVRAVVYNGLEGIFCLFAAPGHLSPGVPVFSQYDRNPTRPVPGALHNPFRQAAAVHVCLPVAHRSHCQLPTICQAHCPPAPLTQGPWQSQAASRSNTSVDRTPIHNLSHNPTHTHPAALPCAASSRHHPHLHPLTAPRRTGRLTSCPPAMHGHGAPLTL